jgi:RimJ/RimL family protein N-acetyltransferase
MFKLCPFNAQDVPALVEFINDLRQNHWSLTALAYLRQPAEIPMTKAEELLHAEQQPNRIGTFLLKKNGRIISMLQLDDKYGDGKVAVFFGVETHPDFQRRGTFWRHLLKPCLREICTMNFERLEAITWAFNRKGIPLYKRIGFRAVPGTSLVMENYLPLILKHPNTQAYFSRHDYIRTLQNKRSYGYDNITNHGLDVFDYQWLAKDVAVHGCESGYAVIRPVGRFPSKES